MNPVQTWRYSLPSENGEGWAVVFVDSFGFFAAITDFGDYSYRWSAHGKEDFREFVVGLERNPDYLLGKTSRREFSAEKTQEAVKRRIIELRRERDFTADDAREEWDLATRCHWDSEADFVRWCDASAMQEPWLLSESAYPGQARAFTERVLPRLSAVIRAELAAERSAQATP